MLKTNNNKNPCKRIVFSGMVETSELRRGGRGGVRQANRYSTPCHPQRTSQHDTKFVQSQVKSQISGHPEKSSALFLPHYTRRPGNTKTTRDRVGKPYTTAPEKNDLGVHDPLGTCQAAPSPCGSGPLCPQPDRTASPTAISAA